MMKEDFRGVPDKKEIDEFSQGAFRAYTEGGPVALAQFVKEQFKSKPQFALRFAISLGDTMGEWFKEAPLFHGPRTPNSPIFKSARLYSFAEKLLLILAEAIVESAGIVQESLPAESSSVIYMERYGHLIRARAAVIGQEKKPGFDEGA